MFELCVDNIGMGISRTISISNTRKITASKKNRMENGIRAEWIGSNPHSNGDAFSRLVFDRFDKIHAIINTRGGMIVAVKVAIRTMYIDIGRINP